MEKRGIDISRYQGAPDFGKLKTEVDFVILQAGFGRYSSQKDAEFERGYAECKKHGIPCGVYWFSYYEVIKCCEYEKCGIKAPYDIDSVHKERQAKRDRINEIQALLAKGW